MEYENVILEKEGTVAILTVNRPAKYNALNTATRREIADVINTIKSDLSVSVLVITDLEKRRSLRGRILLNLARCRRLKCLSSAIPMAKDYTQALKSFPFRLSQ